MIQKFTPRLYQESILNTASLKNTLVVIPTGLGKTNIFLMLAALRLKQYPNSKILLVGPTKPLIDQYYQTFQKFFKIKEDKLTIFTGSTPPKKRIELWKNAQIIFSTPQSIENDIISKRIDLKDVSLLGVDEAHRAVSNYSYVWVAAQYTKLATYPKIMGLTASPGSDMEKITEVCKNLFIEEIEVRTEEDEDVKPYVQEIDLKWIEIELSKELIEIKAYLDHALKQRLQRLKASGILKKTMSYVNKRELLLIQNQVHKEAVAQKDNYTLWQSVSLVAEIIKLHHAVDLLETQGISPLFEYFKKMKYAAMQGKTKAVKNIIIDPDFKAAFVLTEAIYEKGILHPKMEKLSEIIKNEMASKKKIMIFTQYRDSGKKIVEELNKIKNARAELFVGQMKKGNTGLSQKEQKAMLDKFRINEFNILVATSIAEEGLDIPKVDLVIFYEPVPSAIRHIQRKGRTGRNEKGRVMILMAKNTRDVGIRWSSHHKQNRMYTILKKLKKSTHSPLYIPNKNKDLKEFMKEEILIFIDSREKNSEVVRNLSAKGVTIRSEQLKAGDFLCSKKTIIEFKTQKDFINSIIDGRMLEQLKLLKKNYESPLIIIQGNGDLYNIRKIHPHAIQGMLASITINYGIPIIMTQDAKETASLMYIIAKREQENKKDYFSPHTNKQTMSLKEQQEYVVSSFPHIGPIAARSLLKKFGSIKNIINTNEKELIKVENIAKTKAKRLINIFEGEYIK